MNKDIRYVSFESFEKSVWKFTVETNQRVRVVDDNRWWTKNEKLTIFLTHESTIDEFNFWSNKKSMTRIETNTISMNFTT